MKKRFISFVVAFAMLLALLPTTAFAANQVSFRDVSSTAWYYDAVCYVQEKGIMSGTGDGLFSPETTLTRAQLCQILYNIEGKPSVDGSAFSDVGANAWYRNAVNWSAANKIVDGSGDGRFNPDDPITREQMVTILYRYATYKNYDLSALVSLENYSDVNLLSSWAKEAMQWAASEGIISGTSETTITPQGTATRAQVATMLMRFCQRMEAKEAFYAKDIEDFKDAQIINFDNSDETNFAVLVEDAVAPECNVAVNQLISADEESGVYKLSHIDKTVSSLNPGDVFYLTYGSGTEDYLLLKVGAINIDGDTATITEGRAELSDYFQYIDVDMDVALSPTNDAESVGSSNALPAFLASSQKMGLLNQVDMPTVPSVADSASATLARNASGSTGMDLKLGYKSEIVSLTGNVNLTLKIKICYDKTIFDLEEISISVKQETSVKGKISTPGKASYKPKTPEVSVPITAGVNAEFSAYFKFEVKASATGSFAAKIVTENGTKYSDGKAQPIKKSEADLSTDIGGEFKAVAGVGVTGSIKVIKILRLSLSGEAGIELEGKLKVFHIEELQHEKHLCTSCVDGTIDAYFELAFNTKVGLSEKYSWTLVDFKLAKVKYEIAKFYISFLGGTTPLEFGWGECPHKQYLVTVAVTDQFGGKLAAVSVELSDSKTGGGVAPIGKTDADGIYKLYCEKGTYNVAAFVGSQSVSDSITVEDKAVSVRLVLKKDDIVPGSEAVQETKHLCVKKTVELADWEMEDVLGCGIDFGDGETITWPGTRTYTYDSNGNILTMVVDDGGEHWPPEEEEAEAEEKEEYGGAHIEFDGHGVPWQGWTIIYSCDANGHILSEKWNWVEDNWVDTGLTFASYAYTYDSRGYLLIKKGSNDITLLDQTTTYTYDVDGRILKESEVVTSLESDDEPENYSTVYTYDTKGRLQTKTYTSNDGSNTTTYVYDGSDNKPSTASNGEIGIRYAFTYDEHGNLMQTKITQNGKAVATATYEYQAFKTKAS